MDNADEWRERERERERELGKSVLAAWHDDNDVIENVCKSLSYKFNKF